MRELCVFSAGEKKNRVNVTPVSETMKVDSQLIQSFNAADNGQWKLGEVGVGNLLCIRPNKIKEKSKSLPCTISKVWINP